MKIRILVCDDHSVVRRGVRALLESQRGWKVCGEAATGSEAVEKARRLRPDVVVLDIAMPELNGFEGARRILESVPRTRVLILSMYDSEQAVRDALAAGARAYVSKSDLDRDLLVAVDLVAQNKTFFTPRVSQIVVQGYLKGGAPRKARSGGALTPRQYQVVRLLAEGNTNKEVAVILGISVKTAETHRSVIMRKLGLPSLSDLVRYAIRENIIKA
jgi:DNA-binding NarL/FixJ family response regulator